MRFWIFYRKGAIQIRNVIVIVKELDSKATLVMPSKRPHGTPRCLLKENVDLLAAPIMRLGKKLIQSNPLNTETENGRRVGGIGIVRINRVGFKENVGAFYTEGQSKLPVIMRYSY